MSLVGYKLQLEMCTSNNLSQKQSVIKDFADTSYAASFFLPVQKITERNDIINSFLLL